MLPIMSDDCLTPSEADAGSDEEKYCTDDDFDGIDAGFDEITITRRV